MNRHSFLRFLKLSAYWFAINFLWGAMLAIVIPSQVKFIVGDNEKSAILGTVLSIGAFVAMISRPLFGALSDRSTLKVGRRRPFMVIGALLTMIPIYIMGSTKNIIVYLVGFLLLQLFINISTAGYQGLIPDTVAEEERGVAASFLGIMTFLGTISAVVLSGGLADKHNYTLIYLIIGIVILVFMTVTALGIKEQQHINREPFNLKVFLKTFYVNPKKHPDFIWFLLCSFFILLGFYSIFNFQQYYLEDILGSAHPAQDTTSISAFVLLGATVISVVAGVLSDKIGRRKIVAFSALFMASMAFVLLFQPTFPVILAMSVIFGLGYGGFTSVSWALVTDCLPDASNGSAKDLGLWTVSATLPQVLGPTIGGVMISSFKTTHIAYGYTILYISVLIYLIIGGLLVFKIKRSR